MGSDLGIRGGYKELAIQHLIALLLLTLPGRKRIGSRRVGSARLMVADRSEPGRRDVGSAGARRPAARDGRSGRASREVFRSEACAGDSKPIGRRPAKAERIERVWFF